jgi:hypothetical protein
MLGWAGQGPCSSGTTEALSSNPLLEGGEKGRKEWMKKELNFCVEENEQNRVLCKKALSFIKT